MTLKHHLVTMANGESLAKMNRRTTFTLMTFLVWILSFHPTSCNAFVLGVQASRRSPKTPSTTIQLLNDSPAFEQLSVPNDTCAIATLSFLYFHVPTNATSTATGLRIRHDSRQTKLNEVTIAHVSATTAKTTAKMTQVPTTRSATSNAPKYQLNKCKAT
jgi:hypothetical protein